MSGVTNGDGSPVGDQFGIPTGSYYSTGLGAGSPSPDTAAATHGSVVGTPVVSVPFASSQLPESMPRIPVTSGDSSSMSDDLAVHQSALIPANCDTTGIGNVRPK